MSINKLKRLVEIYTAELKAARQEEHDFYDQLPNLQEVINHFGFNVRTGKRHAHAKRINAQVLADFRANVSSRITSLFHANTWSSVHSIVKQCKVRGIGELGIYDMTRAICAHLHFYSAHIDLHNGTKVGAQRLVGKKLVKNILFKSELPSELHCLSEIDLEDFLCIFKDYFVDSPPSSQGHSACNPKVVFHRCGEQRRVKTFRAC